jgi:hypothetical protein
VPYSSEDARHAHDALACHATQFQPATMEALSALSEKVNRGTAYLRPWQGGASRADIFGD